LYDVLGKEREYKVVEPKESDCSDLVRASQSCPLRRAVAWIDTVQSKEMLKTINRQSRSRRF
jgi:hypothetical protein